MLKASATKISDIEKKLTALEEEYPEVAQLSMDSDMSMSADSDMSMASDDGSIQRFPAFEGKDLDGNTVKSDEPVSYTHLGGVIASEIMLPPHAPEIYLDRATLWNACLLYTSRCV